MGGMTTLVIGGRSGIGAEVTRMLPGALVPSQQTVDVNQNGAVHRYLMHIGPVDQVVYTVGIQQIEKLGALSMQARHIIDTNLTGFIYTLDALAATQRDHPTSIVAVVSDASRVAMRGSIAYCASKAGLAHAIRCAAREMAPRWRVNGVSPGVVDDTPMTDYIDAAVPEIRGWTPEEARAYERSMIPMGRRATKREVAEVILTTLNAPEFLTGSIIEITGGK